MLAEIRNSFLTPFQTIYSICSGLKMHLAKNFVAVHQT